MNIPNQKKKKIDVSVESMKDLMQETYNEIVDERNKAITAYKKCLNLSIVFLDLL